MPTEQLTLPGVLAAITTLDFLEALCTLLSEQKNTSEKSEEEARDHSYFHSYTPTVTLSVCSVFKRPASPQRSSKTCFSDVQKKCCPGSMDVSIHVQVC